MNRGMYTYAWDLAEEGVDTVTGRLADAGINTLTMASSYHAGKFLRPHAPQRKVYYPEDGTVYFRPDFSRYGQVKPLVNAMVDQFDGLRELEKQRPDMRRVAWTVCLHNTAQGLAHPDLAAQNAFGDPMPFSLCPSKGAVRNYVVTLCADMGDNYGLAALVLETPGWLTHGHGFHHEFSLTRLDDATETMMGLCFCNDCIDGSTAAGIDATALRQRVRDAIEAVFRSEEPAAIPDSPDGGRSQLSEDPDMAAFIAWRGQVVADLVREIRDGLNKEVALGIVPTVQTPNSLCWREGSDLKLLAQAADFLEVPAYQTGVAPILEDIHQVRQLVGDETHLNFILRPSPPNLFTSDDLALAVKGLAGLGMRDIAFYNYGHIRLSALRWIRDALSALDPQ